VATAIYPGSFDPIHRGHLDLIGSASRQFDRLYVVVAANPAKRLGLFTVEERVELVRACVAAHSNVIGMAHAGLMVDLAQRLGADVLVRSAGRELRLERSMAAMNAEMGVPTFLMAPSPATRHIASRTIRQWFSARGSQAVDSLVPEPVRQALRQLEIA
jgi:pantetheine-phosphate adenylyltransferase